MSLTNDIKQLELWQASVEKVQTENPQFMNWLLHNIAVLKGILEKADAKFTVIDGKIAAIEAAPGTPGEAGEDGEDGADGEDGTNGLSIVGPPGPGVPVGGLADQYLKKLSPTDYHTGWADFPDFDTTIYVPAVTGDLPGPVLVAGGFGECIMVPIT